MKRVILLFFLLFFAIFFGLWIHQEVGVLSIFLKDRTIEMPLWFAILSVLIGYFFVSVIVKIFTKLFHIKDSWVRFKKRWQEKHAQLNTRRGLIEFSEGNWKRAESHFTKAITNPLSDNETSLLNYLIAARAAQELGASERRDDYLRKAQKTLPEANIAIELTQSQLQILDGQWEQALATLNHLHSLAPHHAYVTKLLTKVYLELKDWPHLEEWLPKIRRQKILNEQEFEQLENTVYSGLLNKVPASADEEELKKLWNSYPKSIRRRSSIISMYVTKLLEAQAHCEAEKQCREALKHEWNNTLIVLYGQCSISDIENQLRFAESFLKYYPNNPYLLSALGRIYLRRQLWGKAKSSFLKSVQIQPDASIYTALGELSERLNEPNEASQYYKAGLTLIFGDTFGR
jgi:HemY protein